MFKKYVLVSAFWHLATFGVFGLSFGPRMTPPPAANISFWGGFLSPAQFDSRYNPNSSSNPVFNNPAGLFSKKAEKPKDQSFGDYYLKPYCVEPFITQKQLFVGKPSVLGLSARKEPQIVLHPSLPYDFTIYFKDRQVAHVELQYKIAPQAFRNTILLQRKVSSGNLEADLLIMRYIGHYLFMQGGSFLADKWQTVKIDLSAEE